MTLISCRWMRLDTEAAVVLCTYDDERGCGECAEKWKNDVCPCADEVIG